MDDSIKPVPPFPSEIVSAILLFLAPDDGTTATVSTLILIAGRLAGGRIQPVEFPPSLMSIDQLATKGLFEYATAFHSAAALLEHPHPMFGHWFLNRPDEDRHATMTVLGYLLVAKAAAGGHLDVLHWIKGQLFDFGTSFVACKAAAEHGRSDALWLVWSWHTAERCTLDSVLWWAAEAGQVTILEECAERGAKGFTNAMIGATRGGQLDAMEWLRSRGALVTGVATDTATTKGKLCALKLLKQWQPKLPNPLAVAAKHGQLAVMEWCRGWLKPEEEREQLIRALANSITGRRSNIGLRADACKLCLEWGARDMKPDILREFVKWADPPLFDLYFGQALTQRQYSVAFSEILLVDRMDLLEYLRPNRDHILERLGEPAIPIRTYRSLLGLGPLTHVTDRFIELHDHWGQTLDKLPVSELVQLSVHHGRPAMLRLLRQWGVSPRELLNMPQLGVWIRYRPLDMLGVLVELRTNWGATYDSVGEDLRLYLKRLWDANNGCRVELKNHWDLF